MSGRFVRASSYRHVHGKTPKPDQEYSELKPQCTGEGNFIAANEKFFCYAGIGGGGPVYVIPLTKTGRLPLQYPSLQVHKDAVLDFDFSPFNPNLLATGGEDCHVKVSTIPDGGLTSNLTEATGSFDGHERKINILHFHPTAENILASASADLSLRVWDIAAGQQVLSYTDFTDHAQSFDWNPDGSLMVATAKDLQLRVFDPRNPSSVIKTAGFTGPKSSRALWRGDKGQIIALGSSKSSARQYGLWDLKMMKEPLTLQDIDTSAGVLIPYFDADTGILYAAGKGDGNVRYWEVVDTDPYVHFLSEFRDNASQKGVTFLPKRAMDVKQCEIAVCLRLMKDRVIPISFQVPRKSADTFQKDIYPDAYAGTPSLSSQDWLNGANQPPKKISMNPSQRGSVSGGSAAPVGQLSTAGVTVGAPKTALQLQKELDVANARIKELETELAKLKA